MNGQERRIDTWFTASKDSMAAPDEQSTVPVVYLESQKNSPNIEEAYLKMHLCFGLYESRSDSDIEIL